MEIAKIQNLASRINVKEFVLIWLLVDRTHCAMVSNIISNVLVHLAFKEIQILFVEEFQYRVLATAIVKAERNVLTIVVKFLVVLIVNALWLKSVLEAHALLNVELTVIVWVKFVSVVFVKEDVGAIRNALQQLRA